MEKHLPLRTKILLAIPAFTLLLGACNPKDGDIVVTTKEAYCWQYPGGKKAGRIEAPLGQRLINNIPEGTTLVVEEENELFGPNREFYTRVKGPDGTTCWINQFDIK